MGVQGLFAPTVLAAPGENNPRKRYAYARLFLNPREEL